MSSTPSVGIVLASYNYGRFLAEAIQSVLDQTHQNWQMIIIDDGSTDDSLQIAQSFKDKRIQVLAQPNAGVTRTLQRGGELLQTDFIMAMGADDIMHQDYLAQSLAQFSHDQIGFVYPALHLVGNRQEVLPLPKYSPALLAFSNYVSGSSVARMTAYRQSGGYQPVNEGSYEDWDLWLSMVDHGWQGAPAPKAIYYYRQHGQSRNKVSWLDHQKKIWHLRRRHPRLTLTYAPWWIARRILRVPKYLLAGDFQRLGRGLRALVKHEV